MTVGGPSAPPGNSREDRLDSWKEIAAFFGTTDRTVQRWERLEGLPVHRRLHSKKNAVHAYKSELDQWWNSRLVKGGPGLEESPREASAETGVPPAAARSRRSWIPFAAVAAILAGLAPLALLIQGRRAVSVSHPPRSGRVLVGLTGEASRSTTIPVGGRPYASVLTPDERELYVVQTAGGTVSVIDTSRLKVTHRLEVGGRPLGLVVSPDGRRVYVANNVDNIQVIDTATKAVRTIAVGGRTWDLALSPDGRRLFVTMAYQGLKKVMTETETVTTVPGLVCPMHLAVDARLNQMWVSCRCGGPGGRLGHDWVDLLDLTSERSVARLGGPPLVGGPIALAPPGSTVWIDGSDACSAPRYDHEGCPAVPGGVLHAIRTSDRAFVKSISSPGQARPIPRPDGSAVVLVESPRMAIIDTASFKTVEEWNRGVRWVSFTRDGRRAFFTLEDPEAIVEASLGSPACEPVREGLRTSWTGDGTANDLADAVHGRMERGAGFAPGLVGQAFLFDGEDDFVLFGLHGDNGWNIEPPGALSAWVKFARAAGREEVIIERRLIDGALSWRVLRAADGRIMFEASGQGKPVKLPAQEPALPGVWHHLTLVNTGSQIRLYQNGVRQGTLDYRLVTGADSTVRLGSGTLGGAFAGLIDEVTLHIGEFSDDKIFNSHRAFVSACVAGPSGN
ncbi:MAG: hypothetical protein HYR60_05565 [Acidobacteria bacterium]|nr:hypothetical protein [Acidobacteriota bacterium]